MGLAGLTMLDCTQQGACLLDCTATWQVKQGALPKQPHPRAWPALGGTSRRLGLCWGFDYLSAWNGCLLSYIESTAGGHSQAHGILEACGLCLG